MDTSIAAALGFGFVLGLRHALDPDHLVAVSAIVSEHRSIRRSSLVGTFWGLGHTASLLVMGVIVLLLKTSIPESIHPWMEMPVALMLVLLGGVAIFRAIRERGLKIHTHAHSHEGLAPHKHIHFHHADEHDHSHKEFRMGRRPFIVGLVHGFAGSAAAIPAVLATIPSVALGLAWIAVFGIGSIAGMLLMSAAIGLPFAVTAKRFAAINGGIRLVAGLASVMFGLWLAWELLGEISQVA